MDVRIGIRIEEQLELEMQAWGTWVTKPELY